MHHRNKCFWAALFAITIGTSSVSAQSEPPAIRIIAPEIRDNSVVLSAALWNEGVADWLEVAISGRPSDFLHETLICIPTTQTDLIRAMHQTGFRNATDVARNFNDFKQIRGDRALLLLEVERDGKKETYLLEELMEFRGWGTAVGPLGFYFKGTAPGATTLPDTGEDGKPLSDVQKILMDDPQAALTFKGLQHASRSFLDFSIAYDEWLFSPLEFARNTALLPQNIFNSNGKVPVTLIIRKVTESQAVESVIQYWHDEGMKAVARRALAQAREIDEDKVALSQEQNQEKKNQILLGIQAGYAKLDSMWIRQAFSAAAFGKDSKDPAARAARLQAERFVRHLARDAEALKQRYLATTLTHSPAEELERLSLAQLQTAEDLAEYWQDQKSQLDPRNDPRKDWVDVVNLQLELIDATQKSAQLNIDVARETPKGEQPELTPERKDAAKRMALTQLRLQLKLNEMEIARQKSYSDEGVVKRVEDLKTQMNSIQENIRKIEAAANDSH